MDAMSDRPTGTFRAVAIAGAITLVVTLLRYWGELQLWNETWFSRAPGGNMAPFGIAWLVIPFGFWFGRSLARGGHVPARAGRAALLCVIAFALTIGLFVALSKAMPYSRTRVTLLSAGVVVIGLLALRAWPRAWLANAVYGVLARIPVAVLQYVSIRDGQDTHYAKVPPEVPAEDALFVLTAAQFTFWPLAYTTIVGGLFAVLGAKSVRRA